MRFTGFSVTAGRLPSAVLGVVSLAIVFFFASALVDEKFGLIALVVAVFSPWHMTYSRLAHSGAMLPAFFVILVLWLWHRAAEREYPTGHVLSIGLALGLSASAYQSTRLIGPMMLVLIAIDLARFSPQRNKSIATLVVAAGVAALPQLYVMLTAPEKFFARLNGTVSASTSAGTWVLTFVRNVAFVFSPKVLFWPNMISTGYVAVRLIPIELPFFYLGLFTLYRLQPSRIPRFRLYVYLTFLIAILPALLTANAFSMRISAVLLLLPLWTAAGVLWSARHLRDRGLGFKAFFGGLGIAAAASFAFVAYMYLGSARANGQQSNNALVQVGERLRTLNAPYRTVFVVDSPWYAALHVAAFSGMKPTEYQSTHRATVDAKGWDYISSVGKYRFLKPREMAGVVGASCSSAEPELIVSRNKVQGIVPLDSVAWVTEKYYFTQISPRSHCP